MTKEEKADLELDRANAKSRSTEVYDTINLLKKILAAYYKDYYRWRKRFEEADRALAMEEKLQVIKISKPGRKKAPELVVKLTKQQIIEIAEELGVKYELNFDEEGGE